MTKFRMIGGVVAVVLLAAAAAAASTMRSHLPSTDHRTASAGIMSLKELVADVNKLPTEDFDDQSLVFSSKR